MQSGKKECRKCVRRNYKHLACNKHAVDSLKYSYRGRLVFHMGGGGGGGLHSSGNGLGMLGACVALVSFLDLYLDGWIH